MALVPIREDLLTSRLEPLEEVRLRGSRCKECGEVAFGKTPACGNCAGSEFEEIVLSPEGKLYSFTTLWHRPPGDYRGPDPFQPLSIGLVELPEGIRVLSALAGQDPERYTIGERVELVVQPIFKDSEGNDVVGYAFKASAREGRQP